MRISLIANIQPPKASKQEAGAGGSRKAFVFILPPAPASCLLSFLVPRLLLLPVSGCCRQASRESGVAAVAHHAAHVGHAHHPCGAAHQPALDASASAPAAEHPRTRELLHPLPHLDVLLDELVDLRH